MRHTISLLVVLSALASAAAAGPPHDDAGSSHGWNRPPGSAAAVAGLLPGDDANLLLRDSIGIDALAFSPDSTLLGCKERKSHELTIWSVRDKKVVHRLDLSEEPFGLFAFSPKKTELAVSCGTRGVLFWNYADDTKTYWKMPGWVSRVAYSADGAIFCNSFDNQIALWRASDGEPLGVLHYHDDDAVCDCMTISPDSKLLAAHYRRRADSEKPAHGLRHQVVVWDLKSKTIVDEHEDESCPTALGFWRGEHRLWVASNSLYFYDYREHKELHKTFMREVVAAAADPDRARLFAATRDPNLGMHSSGTRPDESSSFTWDEKGKRLLGKMQRRQICEMCLSPDGNWLAIGYGEPSACLFFITDGTGKQIPEYPGGLETRPHGQGGLARREGCPMTVCGRGITTGAESGKGTGSRFNRLPVPFILFHPPRDAHPCVAGPSRRAAPMSVPPRKADTPPTLRTVGLTALRIRPGPSPRGDPEEKGDVTNGIGID